MQVSLREYIDLLVSSVLAEKTRGNFNYRQFEAIVGTDLRDKAKKLMDFAKAAGLQLISCGSSRCTFVLSSGKGLKIAYTGRAAQNESEIAAFFKFGKKLVPEIYNYDPDKLWIIAELVNPFELPIVMFEETGVDERHLHQFAEWHKTTANNAPITAEMLAVFNKYLVQHPLLDHLGPVQIRPEAVEILSKYVAFTKNGVIDIDRADHWGFASDRRIVCVDTGLAEER